MNRSLLLFILLNSSIHFAFPQDIHRTACSGDLQKLDSMLQYSDLKVPDDRGRSLMHWAVACKRMEVFQYLLKEGLEINGEDMDGYTPLYVAVQFNNEIFLDTLILLQENDEWAVKYGASLLERSILDENLLFVEKLITNGVDIDIRNDRGSTPLEIALRIGSKEIADWLISQGSNKALVRDITLYGPYMGQPDPGLQPQMFAPNFISTEEHEFGAIFNSEGTEFYYGVDIKRKPEIRFTKLENGSMD